MKVNTRKKKESRKVFEQLYGCEELTDRLCRIISQGLKGNYGSERIEKLSKNISRRIKKKFTRVDSVHIHVEPLDAKPGDAA